VHWHSLRLHTAMFLYVRGDDSSQAFEVKIGKEESVGALKKAIKAETGQKFRDVDYKSLFLWKYFVPYNQL
jgi:Crinkler effector protein N-terminal domain